MKYKIESWLVLPTLITTGLCHPNIDSDPLASVYRMMVVVVGILLILLCAYFYCRKRRQITEQGQNIEFQQVESDRSGNGDAIEFQMGRSSTGSDDQPSS